jgi:membrane-bound lytic murein transglycosylase D
MARLMRTLPLALSLVLGACASVPPAVPKTPQRLPGAAVPAPASDAWQETPSAPAIVPVTTPQTTDLWEQLRGSFVMADCDSDPAVQVWAKRYTKNHAQFEGKLRAVLPRLVYVQQIAAQHNVPGEFALLPWVESHFQAVPGSRGRPAGMWQIMPRTAGAMGLRVDGHYDGRLDVPASANAVMKLLNDYHDQFGDWRLADYAYNRGASATAQFVRRHGLPPAQPTIPAWPVRSVTRQHLTKLLAIACVVREPERFGVNLPTLPREQHLVRIPITHSMPMVQAANHAGMSVEALKNFNTGFRNDMVDTSAAAYLLLPAIHARQFRASLLRQTSTTATTLNDPAWISASATGPVSTTATPATQRTHRMRTHTVRRGDSLWQIARQYAVNVSDLRQWNNLQQHTLRPGQILKVSATH